MSEELNQNVENTDNTPEISPVEIQARESGWVPKDEFHGDEHKWVDAAEYLRRGELFKKIETQSKELKDLKKALQEMGKLNAKIRDVEYERALETLKAQKKQALADGDADALIEVDEKIDLVKEEARAAKQQEVSTDTSGELAPEFVEWKEKNTWYTNNRTMRAAADVLGQEFYKEGYTPAQVLKLVEEEIRKEFPHKFVNPNRNKPSSVEAGTSRGSSSGKNDYVLTPDQRRFMQTFLKSGAIKSEQEYIESLKKVEGR